MSWCCPTGRPLGRSDIGCRDADIVDVIVNVEPRLCIENRTTALETECERRTKTIYQNMDESTQVPT